MLNESPIITGSAPVKRPKESLLFIDMLRGMAALWVVLFHVRVDLWVGFQDIVAHPKRYGLFDWTISWLSLPASLGGGGVMLFFLVSGFCIHLPYVGASTIEWKPYLTRRFWRIYPPYAAAVILTLGCELLARTFGADHANSSMRKVILSLLMGQNYGTEAGQMAGNPSLWSLPVEFELYLVYPVFLWLLRRLGVGICLATVAAVSAVATALCLGAYPWMEGNFAHYWLIWCAGALLAEGWRTDSLPRFRPWCLLLLLGLGFAATYVRMKDFSYPIQHYVWAAFYFLLFWGGLLSPRLEASLPRRLRAGGVWLGEISYSLYLIHYPVFLVAGTAWVCLFGSKPANFLVPLAASLMILPLARLFWSFIEMPSHYFGRRLARKFAEPVTIEAVPSN